MHEALQSSKALLHTAELSRAGGYNSAQHSCIALSRAACAWNLHMTPKGPPTHTGVALVVVPTL